MAQITNSDMTPKILRRLEVPQGWTAEQDIQVFVARFGEVDDYFGEALLRVDKGYEQLETALDDTLLRIGQATSFAAHIMHRVETARQHFSTSVSSEARCARFLPHLDYSRFALVEYFRLIPFYSHKGERNWLAPLVNLSDCLHNAAIGLAEEISMG